MTINAANISTGHAIKRITRFSRGMLTLQQKIIEANLLKDIAERDPLVKPMSVYLEGEPGVGKSAIPKAIARALNYHLVDIRANMCNPDDAGGTRMQDMDSGITKWFAPYWMPPIDGQIIDENGLTYDGKQFPAGTKFDGVVLFFDELASADDRVRKPLFGAFLDRELNGREFPANTLVFAGGNEAETGTMVFELDNATRTRFVSYRIIADFDSWINDFAGTAGITPTVAAYLKSNIGHFCMTEQAIQNNLAIYPNPRSWEHVSNAERALMQSEEDRKDPEVREALEDAVCGKVGLEIGQGFMAMFDIVSSMSTLYDILKASPDKRREMWPKSLGQLYALTYSMMNYPTTIATADEIFKLMDEFPKSTSDIPFEEMKAPMTEVIYQRMKSLGFTTKDMERFRERTKEVTKDMLSGPLIKIGGGSR